ncbi:MAG TPA: methyltransferase domain-containing protein [Candidatus Binataceae bacterium]|nr:methyltransferase domain-containing protein [Candidatus Binataceae bacterium]
MSNQSFDVERFKRDSRTSWDGAAAGWEKWWPLFERSAQAVSNRLVELARIKPGDRVLDIATGTGEPAITAARAVGPNGRVIGVDHSAGMLDVARRRAQSLGLKNVEYREGDAASLKEAAASFDAILCRWGLMFVPDLAAAARGIKEALKPGAWLATAVWDKGEKVPMITLAGPQVRELLGIAPPPAGTPNPMSLADTGILERALTGAGFRDFKVEPMNVRFEFDSPQQFLQSRRDISYDFRNAMASQPPEMQRKLEEIVIREAQAYLGADGKLRLDNQTLLISAHS